MDLEHSEEITVSCLKWVPRGAFSLKPKYQQPMTEEEISKKMTDRDNKKEEEKIEEDDIAKEYDMDKYDDIEDIKATLILKKGIKEDLSYYNDEKDPNLINEESDSSDEDLTLEKTDLQLVSINCEENLTTLQVWVYEEPENNLFLHHDYLLSSYGLCLEWMNLKGNHCAVGTFDPEIEIWDLDLVDALEPFITLSGKHAHKGGVLGLSWNSKYQNLLASCSEDTTVKIWDLNQQKCLDTLKHHKDKVSQVKWHPLEKNILLTGSFDKTCSLLDPSKPTKFNSYTVNGEIESLRWNPHYKEQFIVSLDNGFVFIYDYRNSKEPLIQFKAHDDNCTDVNVHPLKKNIIATCSSDGTTRLWDLEKKEKVLERKITGPVFSVEFLDDLLAIGSKGNQIIISKV